MAKTANSVKDRWNSKAYDDLRIRIPKGRKADVEAYAKAQGESINGLVNSFLMKMLNMPEEDWKRVSEETSGDT